LLMNFLYMFDFYAYLSSKNQIANFHFGVFITNTERIFQIKSLLNSIAILLDRTTKQTVICRMYFLLLLYYTPKLRVVTHC
jgi:hypothetical protein